MVMLHINLKGIRKLSSTVANILLSDPYPTTLPTPTLGIGSLGQKQLFQNMVVLHIKLKRITNAKFTVANILSQTPPTLGMETIGQSSTFLEYGHGAYQIKENHECSNMAANILLAEPLPQNPRDGVNRSN